MIFVYIGLGICALIALILIFGHFIGSAQLMKYTENDSAIVFGKKGKGKTLMFSYLAKHSKHGYASNTDFKFKKGMIIKPFEVQCGNKWVNFLKDDITQCEKNEDLEKKTILLDDAGVYLPNFMDYELQKQFPSMPVAFAVWRHLYDAPIHLNCQAGDRAWKLLREQATYYVHCRGVFKFFGFGLIKWTIYDRHASAEQEVRPLKKIFFNKYSKADVEKFRSTYGMVKDHFIILRFKDHKYDSRYFHNVVFGKPAPKKERFFTKIKKMISNFLKLIKNSVNLFLSKLRRKSK